MQQTTALCCLFGFRSIMDKFICQFKSKKIGFNDVKLDTAIPDEY
jgi:hypothetical protein